MRAFISFSLAGAIAAITQNNFSDSVFVNAMGALVQTQNQPDREFKRIVYPTLPFSQDYVQQANHIESLGKKIQEWQQQNEAPIYTCSSREPGADPTDIGQFMPVFVTELTPQILNFSYSDSKCFSQVDFSFERITQTQFKVNITPAGKRNVLCKEAFIFANTEIFHTEVFAFTGLHTLEFEVPSLSAQADLDFGGIKIFELCDGLIQTVESFARSMQVFLGGWGTNPNLPIIGSHVPPYMERANVNFLRDAMQWQLEERPIQSVNIDPSLIQDGDFLAITRLDGEDVLILYGSGSHATHSVMALHFDGELYIVESDEAGYWPVVGLQRHKWADWMELAANADYNVAWLPLREEVRAHLDFQAMQDFFFQTEGLPYGDHNFLYGWIDTPRSNWPGLLPNEFVPVVVSLYEKIAPVPAYNFFTEALNKRLGTDGLDIQGIAAEAANRGLSVQEVMAMPEQDGWLYTGKVPRDGLSYVCSAYVTALYKAGGLFGDLEINATEFTPKDVYQMNIFDTTYLRPQECIDADPELNYCQLMGKYRLTLPGYSTVELYSHMNENCEGVWPDYIREDGC